jgi:hypothetical protein
MKSMTEKYIGLRGELFSREQAGMGNWAVHYVTYMEGGNRRISIQIDSLDSPEEVLSAIRKFKPKLQADKELRDYVLPNIERMLRSGQREMGQWAFD